MESVIKHAVRKFPNISDYKTNVSLGAAFCRVLFLISFYFVFLVAVPNSSTDERQHFKVTCTVLPHVR